MQHDTVIQDSHYPDRITHSRTKSEISILRSTAVAVSLDSRAWNSSMGYTPEILGLVLAGIVYLEPVVFGARGYLWTEKPFIWCSGLVTGQGVISAVSHLRSCTDVRLHISTQWAQPSCVWASQRCLCGGYTLPYSALLSFKLSLAIA